MIWAAAMWIRVLALSSSMSLLILAASSVLHARQSAPPQARSVWDGVFAASQAARGQTQYGQHCAECHGAGLRGGEGPGLVGDPFWNRWRESTVDALLEYVTQNMPQSNDGSRAGTLPRATYSDIVAFVLTGNGFPAGMSPLTPESSVGIQIIRRDGPGELPPGTLARIVGCLTRGEGGWHVTRATRPIRATTANRTSDREVPLGTGDFALKFILIPLDRYEGSRVAATGALIGEGGVDGLNVDDVTRVAERCE